jgi:hypothetical protein
MLEQTMTDQDTIALPVSIGEAMDKLTILQIKRELIKDGRRDDCEREYQLLYKSLATYVADYRFYYERLLEVNRILWAQQDELAAAAAAATAAADEKDEDKDKEKDKDKDLVAISLSIYTENNRRYRIKKKINAVSSSRLVEQKSYAETRCLMAGHLGLGDMILLSGAVRYLSTLYDQTDVLCFERNAANMAALYADDPSIRLVIIAPQSGPYPTAGYHAVYACGYHAGKPVDFPLSFYDDLGMPHQVMRAYFTMPVSPEAETMLEEVQQVSAQYTFVQTRASDSALVASDFVDVEAQLTIDPNVNLYPQGHRWHDIAAACVNKPFFAYLWLIEKATGLFLLDSAFYCLASLMRLEAAEPVCIVRSGPALTRHDDRFRYICLSGPGSAPAPAPAPGPEAEAENPDSS